ncbi:MAG: site-specific integrase [Mucilaginibacter sp.]
MKSNISLLFYLKKPKNYVSGNVAVYLRIIVDGKRMEVTAGRECDPSLWNNATNRLKGNREDAKAFNRYLDHVYAQALDAHQALIVAKEEITPEAIKNKLLGKDKSSRMLIEIYRGHNREMAALVGSEYAKGTLGRYEISLRHTANFIKWKFDKPDIDICKIDHHFVTSYEFYLCTQRNCANNSAVKYIKNFGKIVRICLANGWIEKDPFLKFKSKVKRVDRVFLDANELQHIADKEIDTERLAQVRDIFVFSCFTGLAYADVQKLSRQEIVLGPDGELWINTKRRKTDTLSKIPLLPSAVAIIKAYSKRPDVACSDKVLPVLSNQRMNAYLKELAAICGINKPLTFHIARHTFATTVTLANGVPIESVSKMLGHTDIKTTQHYAKVLDMKVANDMALLRQKLG